LAVVKAANKKGEGADLILGLAWLANTGRHKKVPHEDTGVVFLGPAFRDCYAAERLLTHRRQAYPDSHVVLISDGDTDFTGSAFAERCHGGYHLRDNFDDRVLRRLPIRRGLHGPRRKRSPLLHRGRVARRAETRYAVNVPVEEGIPQLLEWYLWVCVPLGWLLSAGALPGDVRAPVR